MNWFSFALGASLVAVCVAVWSQFKQWRKYSKAKAEAEIKQAESFHNIQTQLDRRLSHVEMQQGSHNVFNNATSRSFDEIRKRLIVLENKRNKK